MENNSKKDDVYIFAGINHGLISLQFYYSALYLDNLFILTDSSNKLKHFATLKHSAVTNRVFKLIDLRVFTR